MLQEGNDFETRKRRACQEAEEDMASSGDDEDRLAGLLRADDGDSDDGGLDEQDKQQLLNAYALKPSVSKLPLTIPAPDTIDPFLLYSMFHKMKHPVCCQASVPDCMMAACSIRICHARWLLI